VISTNEPIPYTCVACGERMRYTRLGAGDAWTRQRCSCEQRRDAAKEAEYDSVCASRRETLIAAARRMLALPPRFANMRFDDLTVDTHSSRPLSIVKRWAAGAIGATRGLYVFGETGRGKTCPVCCALNEIVDSGQTIIEQGWPTHWRILPAGFVNVPDWIEKCRRYDDPAARREVEIAYHYRLVVIDDIGVENPTEYVRERLYTLVNARSIRLLPTVFTSNCRLSELGARLTTRIASRIAEMTDQVEVTGPDRRLEVSGPSGRRLDDGQGVP